MIVVDILEADQSGSAEASEVGLGKEGSATFTVGDRDREGRVLHAVEEDTGLLGGKYRGRRRWEWVWVRVLVNLEHRKSCFVLFRQVSAKEGPNSGILYYDLSSGSSRRCSGSSSSSTYCCGCSGDTRYQPRMG